ncbi:SAG family member [Eimeria mitis]|uniref:SAG family member n=1 Tax=Eimeria mitis TaxID=44415 RepID=U6KBR8_9EIME|nr:SAG family member [Eimeria mitis]CDJ35460.1 SAG family member [Eimeria mitis]
MAPVKLLPLLGATIAVLGNATPGDGASPGGSTTTTYSVELGAEGACLSDINGLREKGGLSKFVQPTEAGKQLPSPENSDNKWDAFCQDVLRAGKQGLKASLPSDDDGSSSAMYGMMVISSSKVDCSAVVDRWKDAYKSFSGFPPAPDQASGLYDNSDTVMFTALFNPSSGATADCRVATCTETVTTTVPSEQPKKTEKKGYAFLCVTTPNVLAEKGTPPFTKEQWEKIASIFKASAPAVLPSVSFVIFAALMGAIL